MVNSSPGRRRAASLVFVLCLSLLGGVPAVTQNPTPAEIVAAVKAKVAPDTRLTVFDLKVEATGNQVEVSGEVDQDSSRSAVLDALRAGGYKVSDEIKLLPQADLGERTYGVVTVSVAVMKSKPAHSAELANQLTMGVPVRLLKRESGWYYAQSLDDRYLGWMEPDHLAVMTKAEADAFNAGAHLVVTSLFTVARERPDREAFPVSDLVMGNIMRLDSQASGWYSVQLPDGRKGYVESSAATSYERWKSRLQLTPLTIERTARLFMGVPYLWGGTSPKGFDCSGFTKTVFRLNGMELLRDANQQAEQGQPVPLDDSFSRLQKGDLLFFGPRAGVTRITHVGIYLGDKRFIHCAGMVKINSFDPASAIYSDGLLKRLVKVKRFA
jgi:cell wall-associated NlpC family hydrolase